MLRTARLRDALALLLLPATLWMLGCKSIVSHYAKQVDDDPTLRPKVVASARDSCLKTSHDKFPQMPNREAYITDFCQCFSEQGLGSFSNSELVQIGLTPGQTLTPEQNRKVDAAVAQCTQQTKAKLGMSGQ